MRVADYIACHIESLGVDTVFLLSGGGMMHLLDAVSRREKLRYVCQHHEQCCAIAAEAYARRSGRLGVCYATSGPGGTNAITGLVGAWQDSSPVLCITGQAKVSQTIEGSGIRGLRQFGTFEVDIVPIVRSITKYAVFLGDPRRARYELEKACHLAVTGRPGPVLIDVPLDVQGAPIDPSTLEGFTPERVREEPDEAAVARAVERLVTAKRPLILAGHGVRVAGEVGRFQKWVERLNVPVVTTQLALDLLPFDHPLLVGRPGVKGDRSGNLAIQTADVILSLGSSLHVQTTGYELELFAPRAHKIQVELDDAVLAREHVGVRDKIRMSVQAFLDGAVRISSTPFRGNWLDRCALWKRELAVRNEPHKRTGDRIHYYDLIDALGDLLREGDTVVADAGTAFYVVGQAFRPRRDQRVIISGALGSMGFTLPAVTGACFADRSRRVVGVTGDGSLATNVHELATIHHHDLDAKLLVVNNDGYVSIRNTQRSFFAGHLAGTSRESGVTLPDVGLVARTYGLPHLRVEKVGELRDTLSRALATKGPVLCEVVTPPEQEVIPLVTSKRLEDGSMRSMPLHDMYPYLDPAVLARYLGED